jgi:hypothetical protein
VREVRQLEDAGIASMENISLEFLLERKSIIKASKDKAKEEMASKGADRKAAAADKASGNSDELSKWGKAVWDIISKLNHGAIVKDTFNQSAADGTLEDAIAKGLVKKESHMKTYKEFVVEQEKGWSDDALPHDVAGHFIRNLPSKGGSGVKVKKFDLKPTRPMRGKV